MITPAELDKRMEAFVRDHGAVLKGFLHARFRLSDDLAGEVMNDALMVIAVKMRQGREPSRPRAYLLEVARNAALDRLEEKRKRLKAETPDLETVADSADAADQIAELDRVEDLRRLVRKLPDEQRRVIELRFLNDSSIADTAKILGIPQGTVGTRTSAALRRLQQIIAEEGGTLDWDIR